MDYYSPSDLKAILHSKRANLIYIEKTKVSQKNGRIVYHTQGKENFQYWNIPIGNTVVLLLGTGTSITNAAARMLSSAGVVFGFCGGGGTPLIASQEVEWFLPQSEYRPTEYVQAWMKFWFDDQLRLNAAKHLQLQRIKFLESVWDSDKELNQEGLILTDHLAAELAKTETAICTKQNVTDLLTTEAKLTKYLYKYVIDNCSIQIDFTRKHDGQDLANRFLNHGNYLAYGLAASTLWVLGIPHAFALMHGKTRRGALVFDVADLIKDAIILPWAFIMANKNATEKEFRMRCLDNFTKHKVLDFLFEQIKYVALNGERL